MRIRPVPMPRPTAPIVRLSVILTTFKLSPFIALGIVALTLAVSL